MESKVTDRHRARVSLACVCCAAVATIFATVVEAQTPPPPPPATPEPGIASNVPFSVPDDLVGKSFVSDWSGQSTNVLGELRSIRYTNYLELAIQVVLLGVLLFLVAFRSIQP